MTVDASNVTTTTTTYDPATNEYVTTTTAPDGQVTTSRTAAPAEQANKSTIESRIDAALADNATYLAIASPTAAQNTAHVKRLTRQVSGILRILSGRLDSAD